MDEKRTSMGLVMRTYENYRAKLPYDYCDLSFDNTLNPEYMEIMRRECTLPQNVVKAITEKDGILWAMTPEGAIPGMSRDMVRAIREAGDLDLAACRTSDEIQDAARRINAALDTHHDLVYGAAQYCSEQYDGGRVTPGLETEALEAAVIESFDAWAAISNAYESVEYAMALDDKTMAKAEGVIHAEPVRGDLGDAAANRAFEAAEFGAPDVPVFETEY